MMPVSAIAPPSCYLNDLSLGDAWALYRIARHPDFFYAYINESRQPVWLGVARFLMLMLRLRLRRLRQPRHWFKALRRGDDHRLLGCVVLLDFGILAPQVAEIAYFISVEAHGRGLGGRAVFSVARWARLYYGLEGLYAQVDPDNPASQAILRRLGLSPVKFVSVAESRFTDRAGNPRAHWVMQTTPQSFAAALAAWPCAAFPVLAGRKRPDASVRSVDYDVSRL